MVIASAGVRVGVRVVPSARGYRAMPCRAHATACHAVLANGEPGIVPCLVMACRAMHTMYHAVPRRAVPHVPHNLPCTIMHRALQHMHRASCSSAVQCGQCAKYEGAIWATNCELTVHGALSGAYDHYITQLLPAISLHGATLWACSVPLLPAMYVACCARVCA